MADTRVLIATTPRARDIFERTLARCPVDFACSLKEGREKLERNSYTHVVIGYLFAESHMFDFAQEVRRLQAHARVLCVKASGRSLQANLRAGLNTAALHLGCEGFFDLSSAELPFERVFGEILARFPAPGASRDAARAAVVEASIDATADELRRLALR